MSKPVMSVEDFDSIQLAMPDIHSVPRGKVVAGDMKHTMTKEGATWDMWKGTVMMGPRAEMSVSIPTFYSSPSSHELRPCIETLTPWPWASTEDRRVGNILCDMYLPDGSPDLRCPRQLLKTQLDALWKNHGLMIKTAFEYEFCIFKENSIEPFNNIQLPYCDLRVWGKHQVLFSELREMLETMGIQIRMIHAEGACGQWELTTEPYLGVHGADVGFYVKNAVKSFLKTKGYDATFMTNPVTGDTKCINGQQMNHSLWKPSSRSDKEGQNVFVGNDGGLSSTAKHWIAGVLTHANALSALFLPSLNCHHFLHLPVTPSFPTWGVDNRKALIRARVLEGNVYLENRLVSGAASPYLALAGTVAAGLDGLERRLECPPPMDSKQAKEMPRTLDQALTALQEDQLLADRLGQDFVSCFVNSKRVMEIEPYEKAELKTEEEQIALWNYPGMVMMGPRGDMSLSVPTFHSSPSSHELRPCIETLTPWPWVSNEDRRVGNILCDMYLPDGSPDLRCPRQLLKTQLDALWKNHGLMIKTGIEYEFCIFKENTFEPFDDFLLPYCNLREWGKHQVLFSELREMLETMGIQIRMIHPESAFGQWELVTEPYLGVHGADVGFYVKNAVKGFLKTKDYDGTFMTNPMKADSKCLNTQHMNHSLWKPSFHSDKEGQNVFVGNDGGLSSTAKHWIAGVLTHANALSALFLPSINCHRFLHLPFTPSFPTWGLDNRKALIRARVLEGNVYLENRLVSGAASPYLTIAGTVAAGLDGLERHLECPPPMDSKQAKEMPHTLDQALTALQEDQLLANRLGQDFVSCFVNSKRELEVEPYEKAKLKTEEEQIAFERDMYFKIY